jgi:RimJ/RimL family protein N-acetyltransferase
MCTLTTPRLILRTATLDDTGLVALSWNLNDPPIPHAEAESQVRWMMANHAQNTPGHITHLCLAIILKESGQWIGWCGLDHLDQAKSCPVLFYLLKAACWGQGLATEAARALFAYAFVDLALERIDSSCAFDNLASKRVMEKLGMDYLGLDGEGGHAFTLSREAYLKAVRR